VVAAIPGAVGVDERSAEGILFVGHGRVVFIRRPHAPRAGGRQRVERIHCGDARVVWIVAFGAAKESPVAEVRVPITIRAPVHAAFVIAVGRPVALGAQSNHVCIGDVLVAVEHEAIPVFDRMAVAAAVVDAVIQIDVSMLIELIRRDFAGGEDPVAVVAGALVSVKEYHGRIA
jgi:hypothetical protein